MKKFSLLIVLFLFGSASVIYAQDNVKTDGPKIVFVDESHDFGSIKEGVIAEYTFKFTDKRNGSNKVIFEKKVHAFLLPNPLVRLNSDNISKETVSVRDLLSSNRLMAYLGLSEINNFPGRINGFRVNKISKNGAKSEYNYGEVFQPNSQSLIGSLQVGDIIIFDNVTVSMIDGTTRTAAPLTYKIVE